MGYAPDEDWMLAVPLEFLDEPRWLEVRLTGSVTSRDGASARDLVPALAVGRQLLLDYSDVTDFQASVESLVALFRSIEPSAIRCAVVASRPAIFGVNRQAVLLAGLNESKRIRIFTERPKAVEWLDGEGAA